MESAVLVSLVVMLVLGPSSPPAIVAMLAQALTLQRLLARAHSPVSGGRGGVFSAAGSDVQDLY
jgi:hypothetical protein